MGELQELCPACGENEECSSASRRGRMAGKIPTLDAAAESAARNLNEVTIAIEAD